MKTIKCLLSLSFLVLITYSCEPEEIPITNSSPDMNVSADTGDQKDDKHTGED